MSNRDQKTVPVIVTTAWPWTHLALVMMVGFIAYSNTFSVPMLFDDISSIQDNRVIRDLGRFLSGEGYAYNPRRFVGYLSFALNYHFGGLNVFGYHLVNLAVHIGSAFLVYALGWLAINAASQVNGERGKVNGNDSSFTLHSSPFTQFVPLFAALLFVAHPVQTQAVTYIVQRLASLATFFYLGAVVCYAKGRLEAVKGERGKVNKTLEPQTIHSSPFTLHHSPFTWYFLALLSGLLALKTKEIAVTLPLAIILFEFTFFGFSRKKLLLLLTPLVLGALVAAVGIAGSGRPLGELLADVGEITRDTARISRSEYLITQFAVIATYLRLLILPLGQNLDYDYPVYTSLFNLRPLWGLLLICGLLGVAFWAWRKAGTGDQACAPASQSSPAAMPEAASALRQGSGVSGSDHSPFTLHYSLISFGLLWFFLTLSVESSIIPIKDVIYEHRLYLPSAGFFLALATALSLVSRNLSLRKLTAGMVAVIILLAGATWARNLAWKDDISLWSDVVTKSPGKGRPRINLGNALEQAGRSDEALAVYREGVRLQPRVADGHNNLGAALFRRGEVAAAIEEYRQAIALRPGYVRALNNLGIAYISQGRPDLSIPQYERALEVDASNAETWYNLGLALMELGAVQKSEEALKRSLVLNPGSANTHNALGGLYGRVGQLDAAIEEHRRAITLQPDHEKAHYGLAMDYAAKGWVEAAVQHYQEALRINPAFVDARNNLGILLVEAGFIDAGMEQFAEALRLNPADADARSNLDRVKSLKLKDGAVRRDDDERR